MQFENLFLPFDQLVAMGRVNGGPGYSPGQTWGYGGGAEQGDMAYAQSGLSNKLRAIGDPGGSTAEHLFNFGSGRPGVGMTPYRRTAGYEGLSGNQSRLGRDIQGFEGTLASGDPVFAQYQQLEQSALAGLNAGGDGLPDDFRRTLTEDVRSSQASRGLVDSDTSAIQEAARLMGGSEQIRSSRLNEVQNYLSGVTNQALGYLLPNMNTAYQGELQRAVAGSNAALGSMGVQNTAAARGNVSASL
jgi:hypothetical protein